ncbi:MAG: hypothetical protein ACE5FF_03445, partial [Saprospiraceae bacterium]
MIHRINRLYFPILWIAFAQIASAQTTLLSEDFNDGNPPNGWDTQLVHGDRHWGFGLFTNDDTGTTSMNGTAFAWFDDDGNGHDWEFAPPSRAMLLTPWLNGTEFAHYWLEFDVIARHQADKERLEVGVWDGTELRIARTFFENTGGPAFEQFSHEKIDLSYFRASQFRIVFIYDDGMGWGWWTGIDNVKISGEGLINDLCEQAQDVFIGQGCEEQKNTTAIFTGSQPACATATPNQAAANALWYRYFSLANGLVKITTQATFNDVITIYDGTCEAPGEELCTNCDEFGFTSESLYFDALAGHHYLIKISGLRGAFGLERGSLCLQLEAASPPPPPPVNDLCMNAASLVVDDHCLEGTNQHAGFEGTLPAALERPRADIWYRFAAIAPNAEILSNATFSGVITLYEGGCANPVEIASTQGQRLVAEGLTIGEAYLIQVCGAFASVEGPLCMQVKTHVPPPPPLNDLCQTAIDLNVG